MITCIIPARFDSTRFPGKPLADLLGKPMIQHVYERVLRSPLVGMAVVATDDERIFSAVQAFGGKAVLTSPAHRSGTDRVAEAVRILELAERDVVVNVQGDQPLFHPEQIEEVVSPLLSDSSLTMSTLIYPIAREEEIYHPHAVKTVCDHQGFALYFSRSTIPYVRGEGKKVQYYKHHGIYAYRRNFIQTFSELPDGTLEQLESLEQLRALEYGYRIKCVVSAYDSVEVDSPGELERVKRILKGED